MSKSAEVLNIKASNLWKKLECLVQIDLELSIEQCALRLVRSRALTDEETAYMLLVAFQNLITPKES